MMGLGTQVDFSCNHIADLLQGQLGNCLSSGRCSDPFYFLPWYRNCGYKQLYLLTYLEALKRSSLSLSSFI